MGLANRLVEPGSALDEAVALAEQIAAFPERCMRSDRLSALEQWSLDLDDAPAIPLDVDGEGASTARIGPAALEYSWDLGVVEGGCLAEGDLEGGVDEDPARYPNPNWVPRRISGLRRSDDRSVPGARSLGLA